MLANPSLSGSIASDDDFHGSFYSNLLRCIVPSCRKYKRDSRNLNFMAIPNNLKELWCREFKINCPKRVLHICEEHINVQQDCFVTKTGKMRLKRTASLILDTYICEKLPDGKTSDPCSFPQVKKQVKRPAPPASQHHSAVEAEVHTHVAPSPLIPRQTVAIIADTDPKTLDMNSKVYKWCGVPQCYNTSIKTPNKLFVFVPQKKTIRDQWLKLARRDSTILPSTHLYFCEDHFDMEKDTTNYMQYKMGFSQKILLADEAMPTKFQCQEDCKRLPDTGSSREVLLKKQRIGLATECLQSRNTTKNHAESLLKDDDMIQEIKGEECNKRCKETELETGSYHTVSEFKGKLIPPDDGTPTISRPNQTNSPHVFGGKVAVHTQAARVPLLPQEEVLIKTENEPTCDIKCEETTDYYILGEPNSEVHHEDYMCCECNTNITGFRYVCVQCSEYMCGACEAGGAHASHYVLRVPGLRPHWEVRLVLESVRRQLDSTLGPPPLPSLLEPEAVPYDVDMKEEPLEDCIMHIEIEPSSPPPLTPAASNNMSPPPLTPATSNNTSPQPLTPAASNNIAPPPLTPATSNNTSPQPLTPAASNNMSPPPLTPATSNNTSPQPLTPAASNNMSPPPLTPAASKNTSLPPTPAAAPSPSNHTKKDVRRPRILGKRATTRNRSEASGEFAITSSTTAVAALGGTCIQAKEDVKGRVSIPGNRRSTRKRSAETSEDLSDTLQSAICKTEPNLLGPGDPVGTTDQGPHSSHTGDSASIRLSDKICEAQADSLPRL